MLLWYSVRNDDAVRTSVCAMAKLCASGDDGEGARARGRKDEADNTHVDKGIRKGNVKVVRDLIGDSGPQCASTHALTRPPLYVKKSMRRPSTHLCTKERGRQSTLI